MTQREGIEHPSGAVDRLPRRGMNGSHQKGDPKDLKCAFLRVLERLEQTTHPK